MEKRYASEISDLMLEFSGRLNCSLRVIMEECPAQDFSDYRNAVGKIMEIMLLDVMNPIYKQHPDLKPDKLL